MIEYQRGPYGFFMKMMMIKGSVFPQSMCIAVPCAVLTGVLRYSINQGYIPTLEDVDSILLDSQAWSGFSFLVGFLIVFRTSQAYNRFWDGCTATHQMRAEWFDACSALVAFCKYSKEPEWKVIRFKQILIRLFSMLHAAALAELEELNHDVEGIDDITAFSFDLIDPDGLDEESLLAVKTSHCKVELLFSWIQFLIVENIDTGVLSIPPPILSRAFQEIANGMVAFHDAVKITYIPFPFPYAQTCDALLMMHWLIVPFVTSQWVKDPWWAGVFVLMQVLIVWSLNFIAVEIDNPFGTDANDLDGAYMQGEMNRHLLLLLKPATVRTPYLLDGHADFTEGMAPRCKSFIAVWRNISSGEVSAAARSDHKVARAEHRGQRGRLSLSSNASEEILPSRRGHSLSPQMKRGRMRRSRGSSDSLSSGYMSWNGSASGYGSGYGSASGDPGAHHLSRTLTNGSLGASEFGGPTWQSVSGMASQLGEALEEDAVPSHPSEEPPSITANHDQMAKRVFSTSPFGGVGRCDRGRPSEDVAAEGAARLPTPTVSSGPKGPAGLQY